MRTLHYALVVPTAMGLLAQRPLAQAADDPAPAFEAASVRKNVSGANEAFVQRQPGGRFTARNVPLRFLITFSYQLQGFQLQGGPGWISNDRFDIVAKAAGDPPPVPPGAGPDQLMLMTRTLLADRFKLVVHRETQDMPIYTLVVARSDGRLGEKLRPAAVDCAAQQAARNAAARGSGAAPPGPLPGPNSPVQCGMRMGPGRIQFGGMPLTSFANGLAGQVQRVVVDRTGLDGNWDFELSFTPDRLPPPPAGAPPVDAPAIDPNGPSLFTAVQEQLGLKLESARGPVEVLVIDSVEQPTPD